MFHSIFSSWQLHPKSTGTRTYLIIFDFHFISFYFVYFVLSLFGIFGCSSYEPVGINVIIWYTENMIIKWLMFSVIHISGSYFRLSKVSCHKYPTSKIRPGFMMQMYFSGQYPLRSSCHLGSRNYRKLLSR